MSRSSIVAVLAVCGVVSSAVPASSARQQAHSVVFEPEAQENVRRFYVDGQPTAVVLADSLPLVLEIQPELIDQKHYIRVWAYVLNQSGSAFELVPQSQMSVSVLGEGASVVRTLQPQTPSTMLKTIDDEKHHRMTDAFLAGVAGGIASALSTHDTQVTLAGGGEATVHDAQDKLAARLDRNVDRTAGAMGSLERLYASMKSTASASLLRRNTLDPGMAANGCVYFDYGAVESGHGLTADPARTPDAPLHERGYSVSLVTGVAPPMQVRFVPAAGE
jgi:hypothetical protein